jgi:hypothetical protein
MTKGTTRNIAVPHVDSGIQADVVTGGDKVQEYTSLLNQLVAKLEQQIPTLDPALRVLFVDSCDAVLSCKIAKDAADKSRNNIPDDDKQRKDDANKAFDAADQALNKAVQVNFDASKPLLDKLNLFDHMDPHDLVQCCILVHGTPKALGDFANQGPEQAAMVDHLLQDQDLARQVVLNAGAKGAQYGKALGIYAQIKQQASDYMQKYDILQRFALACALEHAQPMAEFDTPKIFVDPVKRYLHYQQAFLGGELDPTFEERTIWECRMICNCDAPDEQLGWGRYMLRNYRPDEVLDPNYMWRYCVSVRTEVGYRRPEWTDSPRTYQQLISGGGQCGPRAWVSTFYRPFVLTKLLHFSHYFFSLDASFAKLSAFPHGEQDNQDMRCYTTGLPQGGLAFWVLTGNSVGGKADVARTFSSKRRLGRSEKTNTFKRCTAWKSFLALSWEKLRWMA